MKVKRYYEREIFLIALSITFLNPKILGNISVKMMGLKKKKKYSANFPYLQPIMAELRRNQRGEIGCQHVKAGTPSATSADVLITPRPPRPTRTQVRYTMTSGPTSPTPFRTMPRVLLRPLQTGAQG